LAVKERKTARKILSEFFRQAIQAGDSRLTGTNHGKPYALKNGIPVVASRDEVITTQHIQRLMEEEGI